LPFDFFLFAFLNKRGDSSCHLVPARRRFLIRPPFMGSGTLSITAWLFGPGPRDPGRLWPRWLWLRALGLIFLSAFYSLAFQIRGLIGRDGILPAADYLGAVGERFGALRFWYTPTLLWLGSGPATLRALWIVGLAASILLILNLWPRASIAVCLVAYLSFVSTAQDFSEYQSDGMLLAAGFLSLFLAPPGLRPRLGHEHPPSRASLFMLQWLWLSIYFESGVVKILSHDPEWRHLTALDQYYQNGPLPNWIGWYAQQLPHGFQATVTLATLIMELGIVWLGSLQRRLRLLCFFLVTPFQIGIILTANLAFLNHLALALGILLLDDRFLRGAARWLRGQLGFSLPAETADAPQMASLQPTARPLGAGAALQVPLDGFSPRAGAGSPGGVSHLDLL
jgi:lipase maturation factor 1